MEVHQLSFRYPNAAGGLFCNMSFALPEIGFHALFGPSGVGKTTLARMLTGELRGFSGEISLNGGRRALYTYNLERLPGWSTVRRHIEETAPAAARAQAEELLSEFGMESCVDARFNRLSMGQQNRANLVRYLLQEFDLLIMDESLANVDELTRERIILKIKALFPERCFLYISHNVAEVARFCNRILVLRGASKSPQVVSVRGADLAAQGAAPPPERLERAMLEIVHAA